MIAPEVWMIEERLWTGGRRAYEGAIHDKAVFAFAPPTGIIAGNGFIADLPDEAAWESVTMTERIESDPASDLVLIAYRANGVRYTGETYDCICSSSYFREEGRWMLIHHQQTPTAS